jgi:hypothetical protein
VCVKKCSLLLLVAYFAAAPAFSANECTDEATAKANVERLEVDIVQLRDQRKAQETTTQNQISDIASSLVERGKWTEQARSGFFATQLKTESFTAAEKQKRSQLALFGLAAQTMISYREKANFKEACVSANNMRELLVKVGTINDAQYKQMLGNVQAIAAAPQMSIAR